MTSPFPDDKHTQEAMALAAENKDRELWCEREGDYYADCIFVTEQGSIGINCGGAVVTKSVRDWFALGAASLVHDDTNPSDDFGKARPGERQPRLESLLSPPPAAASEIDAPVSCPFCDAEMRRATWHTSLWEGHKPECFLVANLLFDQNIPKWNHRASPSRPVAAPEIEAGDLAELIERFDNAAQNYGAMQGEGSRSTIKAAQEWYEAALLALTAASAAMEKKVVDLERENKNMKFAFRQMPEGLQSALRAYVDCFNRAELAGQSLATARAEVESLKAPPSEAMLDAARDWSLRKYGKAIGNDAAIGCWQTMNTARTAAMEKKVEAERNAGYVEGWNAYAKRDVIAELTEMISRTQAAEQSLATARAELAEATESWTDNHGVCWTVPTALSYAAVCKARSRLQERAEMAEQSLSTALAERDGAQDAANEYRRNAMNWEECQKRTAAEVESLKGSLAEARNDRQRKVHEWCAAAFGADHASSVPQRAVRLLEETVEAYQAAGADPAMAHKLIDFVFSRPIGALDQELGGIGLTLLALAQAANLSADDAETKEFARVLAKPLAWFHARNEAKNDAGFKTEAYSTARTAAKDKGLAEDFAKVCADRGGHSWYMDRDRGFMCRQCGKRVATAQECKP